jgi:hypothetical protein
MCEGRGRRGTQLGHKSAINTDKRRSLATPTSRAEKVDWPAFSLKSAGRAASSKISVIGPYKAGVSGSNPLAPTEEESWSAV